MDPSSPHIMLQADVLLLNIGGSRIEVQLSWVGLVTGSNHLGIKPSVRVASLRILGWLDVEESTYGKEKGPTFQRQQVKNQ
jgi:hypothetical protein